MSRLRLLCVDDDADIRTIVALSLSLDASIDVRLAGSADEGLAMLSDGSPTDVVILDVMMPGADGLSMLDRMRDDPATARVPVIFLTARGRRADVEAYRTRGPIGVILKPFDPLGLAAEIRRILGNSR